MTKASRARARKKTHFKVEVTGRGKDADSPLHLIAGRLRALRLAQGLTQWALGERGVSPKYYQRIEAGRANVTVRTLDRVVQALGVPFEELFRFPARAPAQGAGSARRRR